MRGCIFLLKRNEAKRNNYLILFGFCHICREQLVSVLLTAAPTRESKPRCFCCQTHFLAAHAHDHTTAATMTSPIQTTGKPRHTATDRWTSDVQFIRSRQPLARTNWRGLGGRRPAAALHHRSVFDTRSPACFYELLLFLKLASSRYLSKQSADGETIAAAVWTRQWISRMSWQKPRRRETRPAWSISCKPELKLTGSTVLDEPLFRSVLPDAPHPFSKLKCVLWTESTSLISSNENQCWLSFVLSIAKSLWTRPPQNDA